MHKEIRFKDTKPVPIGNSKGIRIPNVLLRKYGFEGATLLLVETEQGLLLRKKDEQKLSWEDTYKEMAQEKENWDDFDIAGLDGLEGNDFGL
jgi:antitoxin MazE